MSHGIVIKNEEVLDSLLNNPYHSKLRKLIKWISAKYGILITEGHRTARHPGDVHSTVPTRAIDARSRIYKTDGQTECKVADDINSHWIYDHRRPNYKCCVLHAHCPKCGTNHYPPVREKCDNCGESILWNWHFHLQVHSRTKFIGGES